MVRNMLISFTKFLTTSCLDFITPDLQGRPSLCRITVVSTRPYECSDYQNIPNFRKYNTVGKLHCYSMTLIYCMKTYNTGNKIII